MDIIPSPISQRKQHIACYQRGHSQMTTAKFRETLTSPSLLTSFVHGPITDRRALTKSKAQSMVYFGFYPPDTTREGANIKSHTLLSKISDSIKVFQYNIDGNFAHR